MFSTKHDVKDNRIRFIWLSLLLVVALLVASIAASVVPRQAVAASPPQPTYGTATVNGDYSEWKLAEDGTGDFFANMRRAGDPGKDILSKLYLRYDCPSTTLYVLVLIPDDRYSTGFTIDVDSGDPGEEHYVKLGDGKWEKIVDDSSGNFAWVLLSLDGETARGWEASASPVEPGWYPGSATDKTGLDVHTQINDPNVVGGQTSAVEDRAIDLRIGCSAIGAIGDKVWLDQDANGIQDDGEPGISNVEVNLYTDDGDGIFEPGTDDSLFATQNTDSNGNYLFTNLPAGDYFVQVDDSNFTSGQPLEGLAASPKDQGSNDAVDSDGATSSPYVTTKITLPSGADDRTWDFGYHCIVAGTIAADVHTSTGDPLPGFTANLYQDLSVIGTYESGTDPLVDSKLTESDGLASFLNQAPGYYVLQVLDQLGYTFTPNEEFVTLTCGGAAGVTGFGGDTPTAVTLTGFNAVARGGGVPLAMPLALSGITLIAVGSLRMRRRQA